MRANLLGIMRTSDSSVRFSVTIGDVRFNASKDAEESAPRTRIDVVAGHYRSLRVRRLQIDASATRGTQYRFSDTAVK